MSDEHHAIFETFRQQARAFPNWLGAITARHVYDLYEDASVVPPPIEAFGHEYFEWIDLLAAVVEARGSFSMVELGAGYGRWTVNAYRALRVYYGDEMPPYRFVAVEAEPTHFRWLEEHLRWNGLEPGSAECRAVPAAVASEDGAAPFHVGAAASWYGQMIVTPAHPVGKAGTSIEHVPALSLATIVDGLDVVDLLDVDIQGAELDVFAAAEATLAKVKRVSVGTHGREIERGLRELFDGLGWRNVRDFEGGSTVETPWGVFDFPDDGIQSWLNPAFMSGADDIADAAGLVTVRARGPAQADRGDGMHDAPRPAGLDLRGDYDSAST